MVFSKNKKINSSKFYVVPDFTFLSWKSSKMPDFYDYYNEMKSREMSEEYFQNKKEILYWAGNINTNKVR